MGGSKIKTVDMSINVDADSENQEENKAAVRRLHPRQTNGRSQKYINAKRNIDRTKHYPIKKAVELVKRTSYSSFNGTVTADLVVKDTGLQIETTFPHPTGKSRVIAIANEATIKKIEANQIDFDVLIAEPKMMGQLAKYARILGPRGLMPNPKNKTVTDDPQKRKQELEKGKIHLKTEKKAPLMHVAIGKTNQKDSQIIENFNHLVITIGPKKIVKATISATMSPGIKIDLSEFAPKKDA